MSNLYIIDCQYGRASTESSGLKALHVCVQAAAAVWDNSQRHLLDPGRQPKYNLPFLEQDEH